MTARPVAAKDGSLAGSQAAAGLGYSLWLCPIEDRHDLDSTREGMMQVFSVGELCQTGRLHRTDLSPGQGFDSRPGSARADATLEHTPDPDAAAHTATKTAGYGPMSQPGTVIAGHYTLQQMIGEGGMGEV